MSEEEKVEKLKRVRKPRKPKLDSDPEPAAKKPEQRLTMVNTRKGKRR